ncbi:MAG: hypothetical protein LBL62_12180 [Planctomycetaceae bacterium]|nr:hypothetical protein [Planctomycetaceae bacterium]
MEFSLKVGDLSLKGRVGVLADSELEERRLMVLPFVLESMPRQPARPFSEGIAHLFHHFSCVARLKRTFQCLDSR